MGLGVAGTAAAIGAAGALGGGIINANATSSAANTEASAANNAASVQQGIYNTTRSDLAPYLSTGTSALSQLASLLGIGGAPGGGPNDTALNSALQNYPGYQFTLSQGLQANAQSEAARGILNSGGNIKNATTFGQGLATSTLQQYLNSLTNTAQLGESAGSITGNTGVASGANIGNSLIAAGNASGSGQLGSSLALTGGINGALNSSLQAYLAQQGGYGGGIPAAGLPGQTSGSEFNWT